MSGSVAELSVSIFFFKCVHLTLASSPFLFRTSPVRLVRPPPFPSLSLSLSLSACPSQSHLSPIGRICYSSRMKRAPIGCGGAFVTRLKGVFTGGFFLSATHVEQAANGTRRADRRTASYSLSTSFVISFPFLLPKNPQKQTKKKLLAVRKFTTCADP